MAITWTEYKVSNTYGKREIQRTWTTHEGLVLSPSTTREVRAMSDVYCDATYVQVWNPDTQKAEELCLGYHFELCHTFGVAVVDASDAIKAEQKRQADAYMAAYLKRKAEREAREAAEAAEAAFNRPAKGKVMQVVRGRKVAKGTVGRVFWLDNLHNPTRVGLATSSRKDARGRYADVAWVNAEYLVNTDPAGPNYAS